MHRFFAQHENLVGDQVTIAGESARHMLRVLRMGVGDSFTVVDPEGRQWTAHLEEAGPLEITGRLVEEKWGSTEPPIRITLAPAVLKGDKLDLVVQKATELGVHRIMPITCHRSVTKIPPRKVTQRTERWQRIALNAAQQSGRCAVPVVDEPRTLVWALESLTHQALIAYEGESQKGLSQALATRATPGELTLFTGPEGGFAADEVALARSHGVSAVGLGPRILRAETAALTLLAVVMFQWGDLGNSAFPSS